MSFYFWVIKVLFFFNIFWIQDISDIWHLIYQISYVIYDIYQIYDLQICPPILWIFFHILGRVLQSTKVFHFYNTQFIYFSFVICAFGIISKKMVLDPRAWRYTLTFSSKSFTVLGLLFRSIIKVNFCTYLILFFING